MKVYADGNVMGVSDENGKVICRFEHAGDYVLTTGDELHTYSQCRVHVTEKPFKATVTVRLTGVNGIGAIDRTLEVSSSSTVAEALQQGLRRGLCPHGQRIWLHRQPDWPGRLQRGQCGSGILGPVLLRERRV